MKAALFDTQVFFNKRNKLQMIRLGHDYAAEHECGIGGLRMMFEIDATQHGRDGRKIRVCPPNLVKGSSGGWHGFSTSEFYIKNFHPVFDKDKLSCAWTDHGFQVMAHESTKNDALLEELYVEFQALNICLFMSSSSPGNPFNGGSLTIGVASRMSDLALTTWLEADRLRDKTAAAVAATGIVERLQKAGKRYFALSPRLDKEGNLTFWLNPMKQDRDNARWCTVADLEQWIVGEGPIPIRR